MPTARSSLPSPCHGSSDEAHRYAQSLLPELHITGPIPRQSETITPHQRWRDCGLDELTGNNAQSVAECPVPLACYADGVIAAFEQLSGSLLPYRGAELLTLRARLAGLQRQGNISAGGSCRILATADGHIAISLARDYDWQLLEAWLQVPATIDWGFVEAQVCQQSTARLLSQGRLLGLAIADANPVIPLSTPWFRTECEVAAAAKPSQPPRVLDLSSLWAGPLCSRLLQWTGAEVIKVESSRRPDGARNGSPEFFEFLNAGKQQRQLDLTSEAGIATLHDLIRSADIVIEGSRPRALRQMGIYAEELLAEVPGLTWLSITGYGRRPPQENWVAYGDDAGVAAGLSALLQRTTGQWLFAGDAIADPLTGMHAALAALASWRLGGGQLLSVSLVETVQHCLGFAQHSAD